VAVLDGGWEKWTAEDRLTTAEVPVILPGEFVARPDSSWYRKADDVQAALERGAAVIDVRTPDEFAGKASRAKRKGRIPGAVNQPRTSLLNPDGTMLPPDALLSIFARHGVDESAQDVITYCNGGVSASYGLLALRRAGIMNSAMYDGSWKDWGNDETRPIECDE
jgi:thiosulfate/3-mercaptopyruvate sulfurtransferase